MRTLLIPLVTSTIATLTACSPIQQAGGGVATASALLVALPLLPAAGAYHAITRDPEKEKQRDLEVVRQICSMKTEIIERRNPVEDADMLISRGIIFIMPMDFPRKDSPNAEETLGVIAEDPIALSLVTLTSDISGSSEYAQDPVYKKFSRTRRLYKERFNKTMATKL